MNMNSDRTLYLWIWIVKNRSIHLYSPWIDLYSSRALIHFTSSNSRSSSANASVHWETAPRPRSRSLFKYRISNLNANVHIRMRMFMATQRGMKIRMQISFEFEHSNSNEMSEIQLEIRTWILEHTAWLPSKRSHSRRGCSKRRANSRCAEMDHVAFTFYQEPTVLARKLHAHVTTGSSELHSCPPNQSESTGLKHF